MAKKIDENKTLKKYEISEKQLNEVLTIMQISLGTFINSIASLKEIGPEENKK